MINLEYEKQCNTETLTTALIAALGDKIHGVSNTEEFTAVHVANNTDQSEQNTINAIVEAHVYEPLVEPEPAPVLTIEEKNTIAEVNVTTEVQTLQWFHLIPQPSTSAVPVSATSKTSTWTAKARFIFDFSRLCLTGTVLSGKLYCRGQASTGSTGAIRIYNVTDGAQLALTEFYETDMTNKITTLSGVPSTGLKVIELQLRRLTGSGTLTVEAASVDFVLTAI